MSSALTRFPLKFEQLGGFNQAAEKFILPGYTPAAPFLARDISVVTIGSCFAQHIGESLCRLGIAASLISINEDNTTPFVIDRYLSDMVAKAAEKPSVIAPIRAASLFILTVGVALQEFLDGAPAFTGNNPDAKKGEWRMFSVDEIAQYIRHIIALVRQVNPTVHIVLTLSPIPLRASPNHPSVFGQDCLSKSLIRVAIENVLKDEVPNMYYWPSFEIVRWLGGHAGPFFGTADADDLRHVSREVLDSIMGLFIERYFIGGLMQFRPEKTA